MCEYLDQPHHPACVPGRAGAAAEGRAEHFCWEDGQMECVAQNCDAAPVLQRRSGNIRPALQQQCTSDQAPRERPRRQAFR